MRLVLLAGDLVIVAVEMPVESIEHVAPLEVRHGIAALRSVSRSPPPDAVRVDPVQCFAPGVLAWQNVVRARRADLGQPNRTRWCDEDSESGDYQDEPQCGAQHLPLLVRTTASRVSHMAG
jgi:hypothetical protein